MYLTKLLFDRRNTHARRDLSDPYQMHRTLVRAYVCGEHQTPPRILWRLEPQTSWKTSPIVLLQSQKTPDWSQLDGIIQTDQYFLKLPQMRELHPQEYLRTGESWRFRLFANPVICHKGKRQGIRGEQQQLDWLSRQGERCGFTVEIALVVGSNVLRTSKKGQEQSAINLLQVCFEGRLTVSDNLALAQAVINGIGHGKAFGCGLLSLGKG